MKRIYFIPVLLMCALMAASVADAQDNRRTPQVRRSGDRNRERNEDKALPELTVRAQQMNEQMTQDIGNSRWMRVIYRDLDLLDEKNAPLYYPTRPVNGVSNLCATIFQLVAESKLPAFEYVDGYEIFDEAHLIDFKEVLDRFEIMYETVTIDNRSRYVVNESDVPSEEVKSFYVKEAWFFDQNNSVYDVKLLAICPFIYLNRDFGEQRSPMFWIRYEDLRPYVMNTYIMTSNINNAKTFTIDDYFRLRMFDGEIFKTENLLNIPLNAYVPEDSIQFEQARIEKELVDFKESLWFKPDTTQLLATDKKTRRAAERAQKKAAKETVKQQQQPANEKQAKPKAEKSAPARSVRRGR
ncbi:MAG: gliding motility protein GldN [Tannerella sp.]|jgi:gliding motility associated protien GldN|nr:gliding motility protein GldN [Tannerella sp.]